MVDRIVAAFQADFEMLRNYHVIPVRNVRQPSQADYVIIPAAVIVQTCSNNGRNATFAIASISGAIWDVGQVHSKWGYASSVIT